MAERELDLDNLSPDSLPGIRAYAEQVRKTLDNLRGGFNEMRAEMNAVKTTVKSPDGYVTATVGPRGQLVKLELDPRIYRKPDAGKLATDITETLHKAAKQAQEKLHEITERYAPGMDIASSTQGDFKSRANRFDFIKEMFPEGGDQR